MDTLGIRPLWRGTRGSSLFLGAVTPLLRLALSGLSGSSAYGLLSTDCRWSCQPVYRQGLLAASASGHMRGRQPTSPSPMMSSRRSDSPVASTTPSSSKGSVQVSPRRLSNPGSDGHKNRGVQRPTSNSFKAKVSTSDNLLGEAPKWTHRSVDARSVEKATLHSAGGIKVKARSKRHTDNTFVGRGRGAKRSSAYASMAGYSNHFSSLVQLELNHEKEQIRHRLTSWTSAQLQKGGFALLGLVGVPRGRLFSEFLVRFSLPPRRHKDGGGSIVRPNLPYHRFSVGDVITVTAGHRPPSLASIDGAAPDGRDELDAVVLDRTPHYLDVVVKQLPNRLAQVSKAGGSGPMSVRMGADTSLFRLDQFVNGVAYDRQFQALSALTAPEDVAGPGPCAQAVRSLVMGCLHPTLHLIEDLRTEQKLGKGMVPLDVQGALEGLAGGPELEWATMAKQEAGLYPRGEVDRAVAEVVKDGGLNQRQAQAVRQALQGRLTLVQGPPGTGKTRTACHLLLAAVKLAQRRGGRGNSNNRILATAFSNVAADNLLEGALRLGVRAVRVGRPATVRPSLWGATLEAMVQKSPGVVAAKARAAAVLKSGEGSLPEVRGSPRAAKQERGRSVRSTYDAIAAAEQKAARSILRAADVVVCTCIGTGNEAFLSATLEGNDESIHGGDLRFPIVVIDEATQATEPSSLVPLVQGCEQLILFGDQNQLPPTVLSPEAEDGGLSTSLFCRIMYAGVRPVMLNRQYRMHPSIAEFPSAHFYGGELTSEPKPHDRRRPAGFPWPHPTLPVAFVAVNPTGRTAFESRGVSEDSANGLQTSSYQNRREAEAVAFAVKNLLEDPHMQPQDIGVISPYCAQVRLLTDVLGNVKTSSTARGPPPGVSPRGPSAAPRTSPMNEGGQQEGLEIKSVDGYQGREKEVILLSAVRSNPNGRVGFLADWRRLNVAITRAKRGVVVFGDTTTLRSDPHWQEYIQWCRRAGALMQLEDLMGPGERPHDNAQN